MSKVLTVEQLNTVKKIADEHGFNSSIGLDGTCAMFSVSGVSLICVIYKESGVCKRPEVTVSWTDCGCDSVSVAATRGFMQQMEYARLIAEKLKNMVDDE